MADVVEVVKAIISNAQDISEVKQESEEKFSFTFRGVNLVIWFYWSEVFERDIWALTIVTENGDIFFSTADTDLHGYESYFSTLHRKVKEKLLRFDKIKELLLSPKKK